MHSSAVQAIPQAPGAVAASALQRLLPELVALTLNAKQVHWNVTGSAFLPLHTMTDVLATDTANWGDEVAERAMALGFTVDARPTTVAHCALEVRSGRIQDREAIVALIGIVDGVSDTARLALGDLERSDPVGQDLVIEILGGLDKYRWLLRAQLAGTSSFRVDVPGWSPASLLAPDAG
jgi:starvation-inducible DNA-binding protein